MGTLILQRDLIGYNMLPYFFGFFWASMPFLTQLFSKKNSLYESLSTRGLYYRYLYCYLLIQAYIAHKMKLTLHIYQNINAHK